MILLYPIFADTYYRNSLFVLLKTMAQGPQKKYYRQRAHSNPMADHTFE